MIYKKKKAGKKPDYLIDESKAYYPFFEGYYLRENDTAFIDEDYSFFNDSDLDIIGDVLDEMSTKEIKDFADFTVEQLRVFPDDWWYLTAKKALSYLSKGDVNYYHFTHLLIVNICCEHHIIFSKLLDKFNHQVDIENQTELALFS